MSEEWMREWLLFNANSDVRRWYKLGIHKSICRAIVLNSISMVKKTVKKYSTTVIPDSSCHNIMIFKNWKETLKIFFFIVPSDLCIGSKDLFSLFQVIFEKSSISTRGLQNLVTAHIVPNRKYLL